MKKGHIYPKNRKKALEPFIKICPICGKEWLANSVYLQNRIFCSKLCMRKNNISKVKHELWSEERKKKWSENQKGRNITWGSKISEAKLLSHPTKGKHLSKEHKKKISESHKNLKKISWNKGKKLSEKTKIKMRLSYIERKKKYSIDGQMFPFWNKNACILFDKINKFYNTNGLHAMNGGEHFIEATGNWVDYFNSEFKIIIEVDEKQHFTREGTLCEKDIIRQNNIQNVLQDYKFIRIHYSNLEDFNISSLEEFFK